MKKISTLAFLAFAAAGSVFAADPYYIVKDGAIVAAPAEPEDPTTADGIVEGTYNGEAAAVYTHRSQYSEVKFDLSASPLSPNQTWIMNIEYAIPAAKDVDSETFSIVDDGDYAPGKKPLFIIGVNDEVDYEKGAEDCQARISVSAYEARKTGDQYTQRTLEMFYNPVTVDSMRFLVFSYLREVSEELEPIYIKNLYFTAGKGNRPFYAEDFTAVGTAIYQDNTSKLALYNAAQFHGNIVPAPIDESIKKMGIVRLWDAPYDASGIYDCEIYHALTSNFKLEGIEIPADVKEFEIEALMKYRWSEDNDVIMQGMVADDKVPAYPVVLTFDNGETVAAFADSKIEAAWATQKSTIAVPSGAKTVSIAFNKIDDDFTYVIDQVKLTNTAANGVKEASAAAAQISIYPNPAAEVVYTDAKASKIEVLNLQGAVVASANGNSVNVAALSAGAYVAKVYTAEGTAQKLFIKK